MMLLKVLPSELKHVEELRAKQHKRIYRAFMNFVQQAKSPQVLNEVQQLLELYDHRGAAAVIDDHVAALSNVLPQAFVDVGTQVVGHLGSKLGHAVHKASPTAAIAVGFDPSDPRAAALMRASKLDFVQQLTDQQRASIRTALANAYSQDAGLARATRTFRDAIGLTDTQLASVDNYRTLLESRSAEALTRELRDRRYDPTVERAISSDSALTSDQIDRMVDRYRDNFIRYRAETIALTESLRTTSTAQQEALQQVVDQTGIDPSKVVRTWNATKDKRTRDSHREMDGQQVGIDEPFTSGLGNQLMYPGDGPAEDSIRCRCVVTVEINNE